MNIVFYKDNGIIPQRGGISRITANLCDLFRKKGNLVWYLGALDIHTGAEYSPFQLFLPDKSKVCSRTNIAFLSDFIIKNSIDVIINQNCSSRSHIDFLWQCKQCTGVKVVFCFHNSILTQVYNYAYTKQFSLSERGLSFWFTCLKSSLFRFFVTVSYILRHRSSYRNLVSKNDAVVLLCEGQVKELERICGMVSIPKARVIFNSMSTPKVDRFHKKKHVLWVGNFDFQVKRPDIMLQIWKNVESNFPEWKLLMLGDGPSLEFCKNKAVQLGLVNVCFPGRVNPDTYYRDASILCTTSVHECFPMVILEAMNYGLAIVAFDSFTSAKLLVEEQNNGKLARAFDINEYSNILSSFMQDEKYLQSLQLDSRKSARRFNEDDVYMMWDDLFKAV